MTGPEVAPTERTYLSRLPCTLDGQPARLAGRTWAAALVVPDNGEPAAACSWATARLILTTNHGRFQR